MENKKSFIIRLIAFILTAFVIPCTYLSIRFNLFVSKSRLSIWGFIMILFVLIVIVVMLKFYLDGMKTKWSYGKQLVKGFLKVVLPLAIILILILFIRNHLEEFVRDINLMVECVGVITLSEIIAIMVNPLSKWAFENNIDGLVAITDRIIGKGEK